MSELRSHFGFNNLPFTREIAINQCLELPMYKESLQALETTVQNRMSAALIGPAGTGKTTLLRALCKRLPEARFRVHYVKVTALSMRDFCREISYAVGTAPAGSYPLLVRRLQDHFSNTFDTSGLRPVLLLDEGHDMRPEVLAILRILTNFDMDSKLVISLVLCGQSPLLRTLRRDDLQDVAHRLVEVVTLRSLSREETLQYLSHRFKISGVDEIPLDNGAIDALYEISRGNLRAIDVITLQTLQVAAMAKVKVADSTHVVEARKRVIP